MGEESELRVVAASEILAKIERGEDVEYDDVIIEGDLDISGLELPTVHVERSEAEKEDRKVISSKITITHSAIFGNVNLRNATFRQSIRFVGVVFTNFERNKVDGEDSVCFEGATFCGEAEFRGAEFDGDINFERTEFDWGPDFGKAKFKESVSFSEANFGGVCFADAKFAYANFNKVNVGGYADFSGAEFQIARFESAQFGGRADFSGAEFQIARFESAQFDGDAKFFGAMFIQGAEFYEAKFNGEYTNFWGAWFGWRADFRGALFDGFAYFRKAIFDGDTEFGYVKFGRGPFFEGALFGGEHTAFVGARFGGVAVFRDAIFDGNTQFSGALFSDNADFSRSEFGGNAKFDHDQFSTDVLFEDTKFSSPRSQEVACRIAKRKMEEQGNKKAADDYFFRETEAIRIQNGIKGIERKTYQTPADIRERLYQLRDKINLLPTKIKRFLIYDVLEYVFIQRVFGYGVRPFNVAKAWLTVVFVLGFVYWAGAGVVRGNEPLEWYEYFYFSIVTAATPGYAGYTPATGFYILVAGAQAIFGTFMWAAFIATFARKWQR